MANSSTDTMNVVLVLPATASPVDGVTKEGRRLTLAPLLTELHTFGGRVLLSDVQGTAEGFIYADLFHYSPSLISIILAISVSIASS